MSSVRKESPACPDPSPPPAPPLRPNRFDRKARCFYDLVEQDLFRILRAVEPCLHLVLIEEQTLFKKQLADLRQRIAEGSAELSLASETPVLDQMVADRHRRSRAGRKGP